MRLPKDTRKDNPKISDLYPHLDRAQLKEAEEHFRRYLEVVLQIYERIESNPETCYNSQDFDSLTKE